MTSTVTRADARPSFVDAKTVDRIAELISSVYGYDLGDPDGVYVLDVGELVMYAPAIYWDRSDDWTVDHEVVELLAAEVPEVEVRRLNRTSVTLHWKA